MRAGRKRLHEVEEQAGQSSTEYALVLFAFLAMVLALGALFRAGSEGVFSNQAQKAASHATGRSTLATLQDILMY